MKIRAGFITIFILTAVFIFANSFLNYSSAFYNSLIHIGESDFSVKVVFSTEIKSKDEIYKCLTEIMDRYSANIYCSDIEEIDGREYYVKNIYVSDYSAFQNIRLDSGRFYESGESESNYFLSTDKTGSDDQIGVISVFEKDKGFMIKTLKTYFNENNAPLDKAYIIEFHNYSDFKAIKAELKQNGIILSEQANDFKNAKQPSYYVIITIVTAFLLVLLIMYDMIKSYKQLGIKKMLGYDFFTIWAERVPKIIFCQLFVFILTASVLTAFSVCKFNQPCILFLRKILFYYLVVSTVTAVIITLPFIFVKHVSVSSVLKNQRPYSSIIIFNSVLKFIVFTSAICVICLSVSDLKTLYTFRSDKFSNWDKTKNFAYVSVMEIPNDSTWTGETDEDLQHFKELYKDMNKNGSIYADFSIYSPLYEDDRKNGEFPVNVSVNVNPNYLELFPVYSENGEKVSISEDEKSCVILAPKKYKSNADELQKYYDDYGFTDEIKIIWIENSQSLFTFSLDCGNDSYNTVKDPVICVLTENNGDLIDYSMILGETGGPFKIKVNNIDNADAEIAQICSKYYDESEVRFPAVSVYQAIEEQIKETNTRLIIQCAMLIMLITMCFSIICQNSVAYMEQNQKKLAVKKIMGFGFKDRYFDYYKNTILLDIGSFAVSILFTHKFIESLFTAILLICIDFIFSYYYIKAKDRINVIRIAKGG